MKQTVLVVGGYGNFGRRISAALAAEPGIACMIAGRHPQKARDFADQIGARIAQVDIRSTASIASVLPGVFAVVNACGPYQEQDYRLAEQCIQHGIHYVDLADARDYVTGITRLDKKAARQDCAVVSGASSVPAVAAAITDMMVGEFDKIKEIHTSISMGNKNLPGEASVKSLLSYLGQPMRIKEKGRWHEVSGWTRPISVKFPAPVGRRRTYLCDVPDLELFPQRYGAQTVSFRVGLQLRLFNYCLALLARMKRRNKIDNLPRFASLLLRSSYLLHSFGDATTGIRVLLRGSKGDQELDHTIYLLVRDNNGQAIPCSPAIALVKKWVRSGVKQYGAFPCLGLVDFDDIKAELLPYDIVMVRA